MTSMDRKHIRELIRITMDEMAPLLSEYSRRPKTFMKRRKAEHARLIHLTIRFNMLCTLEEDGRL